MKDLGTETYALLMKAAETLASRGRIPLDIGELCHFLGVSVRRAQIGRARALLVDARKNPKILLPPADRTPEEYTPWERFLIAHELGHLMLHRQNVPKPQGPSEYWKTEKFCDAFARWLLIPESRFGRLGRGAAGSAAQRLGLAGYIERTAQVNWAAAAMRVSDWHPDSVFFQLWRRQDGGLRVNFSSNRKEVGRKISPDAPLVRTLAAGSLNDHDKDLKTRLAESLPSVKGVISCAAIGGQNGFRLAAVLAPGPGITAVDNSFAA